jgi:hypothetical protein
MFERFTERARRVLFFARDEASSARIDRHRYRTLAARLIRERKGLTDRLFADAGIASMIFATRCSVAFRAVEDAHISGDPVQRLPRARATARREGSGQAVTRLRRDRAPAARTAQ